MRRWRVTIVDRAIPVVVIHTTRIVAGKGKTLRVLRKRRSPTITAIQQYPQIGIEDIFGAILSKAMAHLRQVLDDDTLVLPPVPYSVILSTQRRTLKSRRKAAREERHIRTAADFSGRFTDRDGYIVRKGSDE